MVDSLQLPASTDKVETYQAIVPQIKTVMESSDDLIANLANIAAILKQAFDFHWVGFYRTLGEQNLVLGPFQGPVACVHIPFGKGVCGTSAQQQKTIIVADVEQFPEHIACSSFSKSEIVVPLVQNEGTKLVLDIDSDMLNAFDNVDQHYLEQIISLVQQQHFSIT